VLEALEGTTQDPAKFSLFVRANLAGSMLGVTWQGRQDLSYHPPAEDASIAHGETSKENMNSHWLFMPVGSSPVSGEKKKPDVLSSIFFGRGDRT
jgi:hypothetical protein